MSLIKILDRPIAFHRVFVQLTGSVSSALLLSQAVFWQNRCQRDDGWWWKTAEEWEAETGMKRYEFEKAREACSKFLSMKRAGIPCKLYWKVDEKALESSLQNVCKQVCRTHTDSVECVAQSTNEETSPKTSTSENRVAGATPIEAASPTKPPQETTKAKAIKKGPVPGFVHKFIALWCDAWKQCRNDGSYEVTGPDVGQVKYLFMPGNTLSPEQLIEIAKQAWSHDSWDCKRRSNSIKDFACGINQIKVALNSSKPARRLPNFNTGTANENANPPGSLEALAAAQQAQYTRELLARDAAKMQQ